MNPERLRHRSRWMMRIQEWNEPRAPYPNLWHQGMPRHVLAFETVVSRLRLGDLVAVYYPASGRHPERSERVLGIARVAGLRRADDARYAWIDFSTAHRLRSPLKLAVPPRRVFLCCDPDWPEPDVALFRQVLKAAVAEGFEPRPEEREPESATERGEAAPVIEPAVSAPPPVDTQRAPSASAESPPARQSAVEGPKRLFAGAVVSADLRDPRDGSWLAVVQLQGERMLLTRLDAMDRTALHRLLRDPDSQLMHVEAIGLAFPFGVPTAFCEKLLGGAPPDSEGWWALAHKIERTSLPDYLVAVQEFRDAAGEAKRSTDELAEAPSPLQRSGPDLASMAYHGIKMIGEERSRYAIRPFERARARLLLEVSPAAVSRHLVRDDPVKPAAVLSALRATPEYPLEIAEPLQRRCRGRRQAMDAVLSARSAAIAVLSGETEKAPDQLAADQTQRVMREGWIYGLGTAVRPAPAGAV